MNVDFKCHQPESEQHEFVRTYRQLLDTFSRSYNEGSWILKPFRRHKRRQIEKRVNNAVKPIIQAKFEELQKTHDSSDRSVLALGLKGIDALTPDILQSTADTLKTFLFAGHDTTAIALQWAFYELSRTPRALAALRAELDEVLGPETDPDAIAEILLSNPDKLSKLTYASAVFKEILRLYPPAGAARMAPAGSGFTIQTNDGSICVDGIILYICHYVIQRDPAVYGETAEIWMPERWLEAGQASTVSDKYSTSSTKTDTKMPPGAWRPFERGPRNCVGQELSNLEARAIFAVAARRYDFTKVGKGATALKDGKPVLDKYGQYEVTEPIFNVSYFIPICESLLSC
jgi:cytochrome P450